MAETAPSSGLSRISVPAHASSNSSHSHKDDIWNQLEPFHKNESTSQEPDSLHNEIRPIEESERELLELTKQNVKDVLRHAGFSAAFWEELRERLNLDMDTKAIEKNYAFVERCLEEVVGKWLRDGDDVSWEALAKAVGACTEGGGKNVANKIRQKIGLAELVFNQGTAVGTLSGPSTSVGLIDQHGSLNSSAPPDNAAKPSRHDTPSTNKSEIKNEPPSHESCNGDTFKQGTKNVLKLFFLLLLLLLPVAVFLFFSIYNGTVSTGEVLYRNGSVLVGNSGFHTFFQNTLNVKISATSTSGLSFFCHSCNNLPTTNSTTIQVARREQQSDIETNIALYSEYLVDGSTVCFHANITGERNLTDCAAAIYVLDDWNAYSSAFIDGNNVTNNISKYCLNVSSIDQPNAPQCFTVPHPGFFFFGAYIPGKDQGLGVGLAVIQTVANKILYNTSALKPVCKTHISSGEGTKSCTIHLFDEKVSTSIGKKVCVLMTAEEKNIQTLFYSVVRNIHDFPHHQNLGTIVSFAILFIVLVIVIIFLLSRCENSIRRNSRQRGYDSIQ